MSEATSRATISVRADLLEKAKKKANQNFQSLSSYLAALICKDTGVKPQKKAKA